MRRAVIAAVLLVAAMPSAAQAASFGELPFRPVSGIANCLRATGLPGELSRWTDEGVELSTAGASGIVANSTVFMRGMTECPVVVSDPSGFATLAVATEDGVRIAVRQPLAPPGTSASLDSGLWGAQTTIPAEHAGGVRAAISPRGDVLVAWVDGGDLTQQQMRARAVVRPPGGPYGKPQHIGGKETSVDVSAGLSADGEALVVAGDETAVRFATARPGVAFGAPRTIASGPGFERRLALSVGADGRALLAVTDEGGEGGVFERRPGAAFTPLRVTGTNEFTADIAVAMAGDGTEAVAWRSGDEVSLIRRTAGTAFGAPVVVHGTEPVRESTGNEPIVSVHLHSGGPSFDIDSPLHALLEPGGAALLTWGTDGGAGFTATIDPAGAAVVERVGNAVRDVTALTPLRLGEAAHAIAWSDNNALMSTSPLASRVHLAVEGAPPTATGPIPVLKVGAPVDASLRPAESLVLPVRCSAACDIRAVRPGQRSFDTGLTLAKAGSVLLPIGPVTPSRAGTVKLKLTWSSPGARAAQERILAVRVRRLPTPPFPRLLDVRARRGAGSTVDVRWSTDVPARDVGFRVYGTHARAPQLGTDSSTGFVNGKDRRRFHVKLTAAARVRWVRVAVAQDVGTREREILVRVR